VAASHEPPTLDPDVEPFRFSDLRIQSLDEIARQRYGKVPDQEAGERGRSGRITLRSSQRGADESVGVKSGETP
jgi:hypothetical protein